MADEVAVDPVEEMLKPLDPAPEPPLSDAEKEEATLLYAQLEPAARMAYVNGFLSRTPIRLMEEMKGMVTAPAAVAAPPVAPPPAEAPAA